MIIRLRFTNNRTGFCRCGILSFYIGEGRQDFLRTPEEKEQNSLEAYQGELKEGRCPVQVPGDLVESARDKDKNVGDHREEAGSVLL